MKKRSRPPDGAKGRAKRSGKTRIAKETLKDLKVDDQLGQVKGGVTHVCQGRRSFVGGGSGALGN